MLLEKQGRISEAHEQAVYANINVTCTAGQDAASVGYDRRLAGFITNLVLHFERRKLSKLIAEHRIVMVH